MSASSQARGKKFLVLGVVLLLVVGGVAWWWLIGRHVETTDNAYVRADSVAISPMVSGYVAEVGYGENQAVEAGAVLVRIDDRDYRARLAAAKSALGAARAERQATQRLLELQAAHIAQAEAAQAEAAARARQAGLDRQRDRNLSQQGYATAEALDSSSTAVDAAQAALSRARAGVDAARQQRGVLLAQLQRAEAAVEQAQARQQTAQLDLEHTVLQAPFDGVLGNRSVEPGAYVRPGTQLYTLVPLRRAYVVANFKETQIAHMRVGQHADVDVDAFGGGALGGRIVSIAPATGSEYSLLPRETATGNFTKIVQWVPVRIELDAHDPAAAPRLRAGLSVVVRVDTRDRPAAQVATR